MPTVDEIRAEQQRRDAWIEEVADDFVSRWGRVCSTDIVDTWEAQAKGPPCTPESAPPHFIDRRQAFSAVQSVLRAWGEREGLRSKLERSTRNSGMKRRYYLRD